MDSQEIELRESLDTCVSYLCARLGEIADGLENVKDVHIPVPVVRNLIGVARDLVGAIEALNVETLAQEVVVRFTDSESEPQNMGV